MVVKGYIAEYNLALSLSVTTTTFFSVESLFKALLPFDFQLFKPVLHHAQGAL